MYKVEKLPWHKRWCLTKYAPAGYIVEHTAFFTSEKAALAYRDWLQSITGDDDELLSD